MRHRRPPVNLRRRVMLLHKMLLFFQIRLRRTICSLVAFFVMFPSVGVLNAQDSLSTLGQQSSGRNGVDSSPSSASSPTSAGPGPKAAGFGQSRETAGNSSANSTLWNRLLLDAFQFGMYSSNLSGGAGSGGSSNGGGQGIGSGSAFSSGSETNPTGNAPGGSAIGLGSLFQLAGNMSRDLGAGKSGVLGTALGALPALNQLTRGGLNLPLNSSIGNFRLSYRDLLNNGGNELGGNLGSGAPSASFTSSHFKAGKIDFSAAASVNGESASGGSGMSAGISSFGGQASGGGQIAGGASLTSQTGGGAAGNSMGGPSGGAGGGQSGGNNSSGGGGKRPTASLSLHLNF
jgi:hypothetical protein